MVREAATNGKGKVGDEGKPQLVFDTFPEPFVSALARCLLPSAHTPTRSKTHTNTRQSNLIQTISESATFLQLHGAICKSRVRFSPKPFH